MWPCPLKMLKLDTLWLTFNSGLLVSIKNWKSLKATDTGWLSWWLRQLSGFEARPLSKIQNGRHKQRSGQHTLARQKNRHKKVWTVNAIHSWVKALNLSQIKFSLVVRASDCQCRSHNSPGFDPNFLCHSGIWGAADEAVSNTAHRKKTKKSPVLILSQWYLMEI